MGSACGAIGGLFGSKQTQTQQQQQSSNQSGQTNSNFLPQLQEAFGTLQSQYANLGSMGANPWQTGAADAQMGVAGNLQPAYGAAGNVATSGIGDVSRYMSPYISSVVDATRADFAAQNARDLSNVNAQAARTGALTGTGAAAARNQAMEAQRRTQDATIANLYNQGFAQSGQLAQADASARLAGANSIGSLVGANSGANATLGSLGQGAFQSNLAPYSLASQYAQSTAGLAGQAGTNFTGQSSGTGSSTGTTEGSQGIGTVASGLLGMYLMGRKADGGAVTGDANGDGIMDRYQQTLATLHRMHGGSIPGMARGGAVSDDAPRFQTGARVTEETTNIAPNPQFGMPYSAPQPEAPRMDLGGPQPQASSGFDFGSLLPSYDHGVWKGEKPSESQLLGRAFLSIGEKPIFKGFGDAAFDHYNKEEERRRQRDQFAKQLQMQASQALGSINGQKTVQALQQEEAARHNKAMEESGNWMIDPQRGVAFNKKTMETRQLDDEFARRAEQAAKYGMDPNSSEYKQFVLTNKMGSDALSPIAQKQILEAEDVIRSGSSARDALNSALALNDKTYQGAGAKELAWLASNVPGWKPQAAIDTLELNNLVQQQVLDKLKATFGGNPTEGERKILLDVAGSVNLPAENRRRILQRALDSINQRESYNRAQIDALKNKTFFKPTPQQPGVNGPAGGERTDKSVTDRLPSREGSQGGIPPDAIRALQANPDLAPQFDAKYGAGASRQYLMQR